MRLKDLLTHKWSLKPGILLDPYLHRTKKKNILTYAFSHIKLQYAYERNKVFGQYRKEAGCIPVLHEIIGIRNSNLNSLLRPNRT